MSSEEYILYKRIADQIRIEILEGHLQPGDRLPSIRELTRQWNCTPGTVQKAYQELSHQGLVISRAGKGTHVASNIDPALMQSQGPLRRATLVHRAEEFLLEVLTAGYELPEIQQSLDLAMDRWRALAQVPSTPSGQTLHFYGSHDMAVTWLANHVHEIAGNTVIQLNFTGSLGGLMALADGRADLAGCHLWDPETDTYNIPYIRKFFPGKHMLAVRLAERRIGLILPPGNPKDIRSLADLTRPGVRFVNRQAGSGTRVWLDAMLTQQNIHADRIDGYENEKPTHSEVARAIAEGAADVGLGLESAALAFKLESHFLVVESYDLVTFAERAQREPLHSLLGWLTGEKAREGMGSLKGYSFEHTGEKIEV
ncbi:periplasmic molybdate-binding protein [Longilinea arvoryzae]|uniref:Periplasmic molybdate-binding protein n=1 Tax=Longilinea arvoryzae TaxID=360412 RepID=A0A0S7B7J7_9CHLR|nr:substrate-binding domain-containing protein [Longilinea arvoryzae]GAP13388.1 periplasmic molybdate-binding protein [Longilinea arvoryzae]